MVYISAEIPITALVGSLEERIVLCLIQNGIQVILVIEGGRYQNSWVTYYLEALCAMAVVFIPCCHEWVRFLKEALAKGIRRSIFNMVL